MFNKQLLVATNNRHKLQEITACLAPSGWKVIGLGDIPAYPEPEETGSTFLENSLIKARIGYQQSGMLTVADDSGLEVTALDNRPGVFSARYVGDSKANLNKVLQELTGVPIERRSARFVCVMALVGDGIEHSLEGMCEGYITTEPKGVGGFGYDPIFYSPELGMTFAEAPPDVKNSVSHRGRAIQKLVSFLNTLK